jgi:recombinational DNA repair protein (RecF pathway)
MGVAPNIDTCSSCGRPMNSADGAFLRLESGGAACIACARTGAGATNGAFLPPFVLRSLRHACGAPDAEACCLPASEVRRITRLLARYCQYHFHHVSDFKSLAFLDSMLPGTAP